MKYIYHICAVLVGFIVTVLCWGLIWALTESIEYTVVGFFIGIINYPFSFFIGLIVARLISGESLGVAASMIILGIIYSIFQIYTHFSHGLGIELDRYTGTLIGALIVVALPFYLVYNLASSTTNTSMTRSNSQKVTNTSSPVRKENHPPHTLNEKKTKRNKAVTAVIWVVIMIHSIVLSYLFLTYSFNFREAIIIHTLASIATSLIIYLILSIISDMKS